MTCPDYYEFSCKGRLISGHTALEEIPNLLLEMGTSSPMVLTDEGVKSAGLLDILIQALGDCLTLAAVEDQVPPDSDVTRVRELATVYRDRGCDSLIALGGGSVLDTAKGINILVSNGGDDIMAYAGTGALTRRLRPLIAVPTTAGTGSEVTLVAVIADPAQNRKQLFSSPFLLPDVAVVDSRMTLTLPPHITALTGMDALSHAVEACFCLGRNPLSQAHAHAAIDLIRGHLIQVVTHPSDREGRLAMATAATLAGMAFSNAMVGMVHALGHSVGAVCHLPHGTCMAVLLPYGMEYNQHLAGQELGDLLLPLAGARHFSRTPDPQRPQAAVEAVRALNTALNQATDGRHPLRFKDCLTPDGQAAVTRPHLEIIARTALGDGAQIYNPEDMNLTDMMTVLEAAWEGRPLIPSQRRR